MNFTPSKWPKHDGRCVICGRNTKQNVHQRCGLAHEAALRAKRHPRLAIRHAKAGAS